MAVWLHAVDFEMWHLELILALVVLISSSRYILLKTWPDFSKSSEAANQQVWLVFRKDSRIHSLSLYIISPKVYLSFLNTPEFHYC